MQKCDYGCDQEGKYQFKNGRWCCSKRTSSCSKVREKIAEKHKGIKLIFTETHKQNISKALKGKTLGRKRPNHSKRMKENNPMKGVSLIGDMNGNWKGGISNNPYCSGWSSLSEEMRGYYKKCQNPYCCGKSNRLTIHHINYDKENCSPDNLICLCNICNGKANGNRNYHEQFYKEIKKNE